MRASLLDTLDDFERWGRDIAYVFPRGYRHERWSYRRVAGVAYQFARELESRNIRKGDAVLLWGPNCAEWVAAFLGCALCGVIAVPVDDAASADFACRIGAQVRTKLVVCPRERAAIFGGGANGSEQIATIDPIELEALVARHPSYGFRPAQVQPSDTLEIVFTSGTTADPKGVVITHANVVSNLVPIENEIRKYLKYERLFHPTRFLNLLPLSHVFGQFLGIFLPPLLGGTVVFEDTFNPGEIMQTIRRERISVLVAVPRMIESLKQKVERDLEKGPRGEGALPRGLSNFAARFAAAKNQHFLRRWWSFRDVRRRFGWKFWAMISGGAALDRETEEFWHRLGYAVIQGYGLTETTSLISLNHPFHTSRGSIGKVLPGREMKLAEDGEILVRGSGVASNYWQGEHAGLQPLAHPEDAGWYRTGDLGTLDEQGNLFFKGRKKEVIVTPAGMNIYPDDLELALRAQPEVRDCVVVGLERNGNAEPCAVLILLGRNPEASEATAREAVQRANEKLAEFQRMRVWFVWPDEDFPRSSTQKPRRNLIRDAAEAGLRGLTPANHSSPLSELIARITGRPAQPLAPDANLESGLGLSSLERVELLSALEDRYQIELSETEFANAATVGDLEKLLQDEKAGHAKVDASRSQADDATSPQSITPPFRELDPVFHYPRWALHWPTTWLRMAVRYLLARPALFLLARPRVIGRENLHGVRGPVLVVSNHISDVDIAFVQTALPARIRHKLAIATRGELLEKLHSSASDRMWPARIYDRVKWMLAVGLLNLFPLPRQTGFRKSFAYVGEAVDRGYSVLIFPEGKHTPDGKLQPFRTGVGLLANKLGIPVVPMRIDGLFEIKLAGKKHAAPGKIVVRIGKPQWFDREAEPAKVAQMLQQAVAEL